MSPLLTVCHKHQLLVPDGERCPSCAEAGKVRRRSRNRELGRQSAHWRRLSSRMTLLVRRELGARCPGCGTVESASDPGSKLTCDLVAGGDHSKALERDCRVRCRRCHGRLQGGRGRPKGQVARG